MYRYKIVNHYRLYEFLLGITLLLIFIAIALIKTKFGVVPVKADSIDTVTKIPVEQSTVDIDVLKAEYERLQKKVEEQKIEINNILEEIKQLEQIKKTEHKDLGEFKVTAYDLSFQSCEKLPTSRGYGITKDGTDLRKHNWETARVIAVDPKVIKLGSKVYVEFLEKGYEKYSGVYTCRDIGGAIKGKHIDLFYEDTGEQVSKKAMEFGVTKARVILLKE